MPTFNVAKAGTNISIPLSLVGSRVNIFATGYPQSTRIACDTGADMGDTKSTVTPLGWVNRLGAGGQFYYTWKTDITWASTCRKLVVKLIDGTFHYALFMFK
jgi:hypothetical protein